MMVAGRDHTCFTKAALWIAVVILCTFIPRTADAAVIHVPADHATIQQAIDAAANGDTVDVAPGLYQENIDFHGKSITVESTGGPSATTIDGGGKSSVVTLTTGEGINSVLAGFTIQNGSAPSGGGMLLSHASPTILGNVFLNNTGAGSAISGDSASPMIAANLFHDHTCTDQPPDGVVSFLNQSAPSIVNNVFNNNQCPAVSMSLSAGMKPHVINNTIVNNTVGIRVDASAGASAQIYENNILTNNQIGLQTDYASAANNPAWKYNLISGDGNDFVGASYSYGVAGNISADPLFIDSRNDFRLQFGSPAINAGDNGAPGLPATDFEGHARIQNGTVDLGAYEFFSTTLSLSPASLTFGIQAVGTSSSSQTVALNNTGTLGLTASIAITGDFTQTNNCGGGVAAGGGCSIQVTFTPTADGPRTGSLTVMSNATSNPNVISLSGNSTGPAVSLSPTSLSFGNQLVGTTSAPQKVTVTNSGTAALAMTGISASGDFAQSNNCPTTLAVGASCTASVTFSPTKAGQSAGGLNLSDNGAGSPQTVVLTGMGTDFSVAPAPTSPTLASVAPGQSAAFTLVSAGTPGFSGTIALTCSGAPQSATCSVSPPSVTLTGVNDATITATVTTTATSKAGPFRRPGRITPPPGLPLLPWLLGFVLMAGLTVRLAFGRGSARWRLPVVMRLGFATVMLMVVTPATVSMSACGGGSGGGGAPQGLFFGTPAGTYALTVTGTVTSGGVSAARSTNLTLTVH